MLVWTRQRKGLRKIISDEAVVISEIWMLQEGCWVICVWSWEQCLEHDREAWESAGCDGEDIGSGATETKDGILPRPPLC